MRSFSWILKAWFALLAGLVLATPAAAQYGSAGDYQILQARYGTASHNVDVTERLRELARSYGRIEVSNDTLRVDPDVGAHKSLRIFARGRDGVTRMFEFTERSSVDGAQFAGWSSGGWGYAGGGYGSSWEGPVVAQPGGDRGEYQILHARYGTASRNIDVTGRLKELASRDRQFRVTNSTFGDDPDVGAHKTLRIFARDASGATRTFEYGENGIVDGAVFTGWSGGNWGYGGGYGGWEGPGVGQAGGDRGEFQILGARYGTAARNVDVTQRLKVLAHQDVRFRVSNATFGDDPDVGAHKTLRIYARGLDGVTRMFEYTEGGTVDGAQFIGWSGGNWGHGGHDRWESGAER